MVTIVLNAENSGRTLTANDTVLVDFWASWCGPCRPLLVHEATRPSRRSPP